jgi:hypothetical protein|tara:strand:+ start:6058 stop:6210 length:153 start_codon:yes stop_codon:yes gene_type:complete
MFAARQAFSQASRRTFSSSARQVREFPEPPIAFLEGAWNWQPTAIEAGNG